ncbi:hypothetical protein [Paenibacillus roseipurpureus]|uniref:Uncharacterized protein n=1 Tax=Paenibacillus roseopurpureus TaxID=2918901 RepID=A0AA96RJ95_9BACL|nr:hypothetical protein [Paenibacillus sp. MBLB1832]WNR43069.1 hypothetical protein MJB10_18385 [Paenibacillus sp. MBLB1832]
MKVIKQAWKELYKRYSEVLGEDAGKQLTKMLYESGSQLEQKL